MTVSARMARIRDLAGMAGRDFRFMEVCGTHTMSVFRSGLKSMLPCNVSLLSGPGCPVCVTPDSYLDRAIAIARMDRVAVCTFGDMLRVPGSEMSLEQVKAAGADVRVLYSPSDALKMAENDRNTRVVFLGVGFETTTPSVAWTIRDARDRGVSNYSVLCAHKTIPEAMSTLLGEGDVPIDGFMCPGHVSVITGSNVFGFICREYGKPCVVAGFEASDIVQALEMLLIQVGAGRAEVEIQYSRSVTPEGNLQAKAVCDEVFEKCDSEWRGLGVINDSGLRIRDEFSDYDAGKIFAGISVNAGGKKSACICGEVLKGKKMPPDCPFFGNSCTPVTPVGACMVSSEGTCAAFYRFSGMVGQKGFNDE